MNKLILIDADILVYQMGFSAESPVYVCGGRIYKTRGKAEIYSKESGKEIFKRKNISSFNTCRKNLKIKLEQIFEDLGTRNYKMFITASKVAENFRSKVATLLPYKGNRGVVEKPFHYQQMRNLLVKEYGAIVITGQEADDAIGIEQYKIMKEKGSAEHTYIASIDKDLRMLEGWHYHLDSREISFIDFEEAYKNFCLQILTGDATDNIPGLTRLLKLRGRLDEARKLSYSRPGFVREFESFRSTHTAHQCFNYVLDKYKSYAFGTPEIEEIGQLLWIRREELPWNLDYANKTLYKFRYRNERTQLREGTSVGDSPSIR